MARRTPRLGRRTWVTSRARTAGVVAVLLVVAVVVGTTWSWTYAPLLGWDAAATFFLVVVWTAVGRMDPRDTASHATRENPGRTASDGFLLSAALASLAAVGLVLAHASDSHTVGARAALGVLCLVSVAESWLCVQTLYMLRYASLYYAGPHGGIDYNQDAPPRYADFAYLAFTLGMTYQVSDTDLQTSTIRAAALRHGLLSYVFGSVILASTINVVVSLTSS